MPKSSWCDFSCCCGGKQNRPFTKFSVTWKSSTIVFLSCCTFRLELTSVTFPGRQNCILIIMQVKVGRLFSDVVENWHDMALKEMIYDLKIKTDIIEEGILDVVWILLVVENRKAIRLPCSSSLSFDTEPDFGASCLFLSLYLIWNECNTWVTVYLWGWMMINLHMIWLLFFLTF